MPCEARAWFLYEGAADQRGTLAELRLERFTLRDPGPGEVLVEPLYGSWEGNFNHALTRTPIDVCRQRGEPRIVLGNAGVVRVLATGEGVTTVRPGQIAMIFASGEQDRYGYITHAFAFDARGTIGCMATRTIFRAHQLIPLPERTRHSPAQWAAFSVRYVTAWSNWELALGTFRLQVGADLLPRLHVWGWGGGTTLAELDLAQRAGHQAVMISGDAGRLAWIERLGLGALDRRLFADLSERLDGDPPVAAREAARKAALQRFIAEVDARTGGERVQIFVDNLGGPVLDATLRALGRCGVLATAGWKLGMETRYRRAMECIQRHQHIHTHFARRDQALAAVAYGEAEGWMPALDGPIHDFAEIPLLARRFADNQAGFFPVFTVNPE